MTTIERGFTESMARAFMSQYEVAGRGIFLFLMLCAKTFLGEPRDAEDFQFRTGLKINKEFRKGFDLGLEYQARLDNNAAHFRGSYFTISPEYKLNKQVSLLTEFRLATSDQWDKYRYGVGLNWRVGYGKWRFTLQAKYQYETYGHSLPEIGQFPPSQFLRMKGEAAWRAVR